MGLIFLGRIFGTSKRLLDIWPSLVTSPILTHFSWSPLITAALALNAHIIHPALSSATPSDFTPSSVPAPLSGLLALHIRRGDYLEHCNFIANWSASFMGFNEFPELPDRFSPPAVNSRGNASLEEHARYRAHCFPEIEQIVARVHEVRASLLPTTTLTRVYVLTNGPPQWLRKLKRALQEDARRRRVDEWKSIGTSRDLRLTVEQRHNSHAVDMAIGQRAEVFLGTGVCGSVSFFVKGAKGVDPRGLVLQHDIKCRDVACRTGR
jgi:GDP-fucose protein O-fucosyltransferase